MTKAEELRDDLLLHGSTDTHDMKRIVNAIIAASHAEGVAEGAERLKTEIMKHSEQIREHPTRYAGDPEVEDDLYYVVPASVLVPEVKK